MKPQTVAGAVVAALSTILCLVNAHSYPEKYVQRDPRIFFGWGGWKKAPIVTVKYPSKGWGWRGGGGGGGGWGGGGGGGGGWGKRPSKGGGLGFYAGITWGNKKKQQGWGGSGGGGWGWGGSSGGGGWGWGKKKGWGWGGGSGGGGGGWGWGSKKGWGWGGGGGGGGGGWGGWGGGGGGGGGYGHYGLGDDLSERSSSERSDLDDFYWAEDSIEDSGEYLIPSIPNSWARNIPVFEYDPYNNYY